MSDTLQSLKKRICNPPAVRMAECGDPEVCGLFEGAGDGLEFALEQLEYTDANSEVLKALADYEKEVVTIEAEYIHDRKKLAAQAVRQMQDATHRLMKAVGGEAYGGG